MPGEPLSKLALPPARRFAILTCMDARIDPAKLAGLSEGDAHVIRNAGGRASDDGKVWQDSAEGPGSREGDFVDWLTIRRQDESVLSDVQRIRSHPLVPKDIAIYGYVYQVETGRLIEVPAANRAGQAA